MVSGEPARVSVLLDMLWTAGGDGEGDKVMMCTPGVDGDSVMLLCMVGERDVVKMSCCLWGGLALRSLTSVLFLLESVFCLANWQYTHISQSYSA